jgi:uncharacterized protein
MQVVWAIAQTRTASDESSLSNSPPKFNIISKVRKMPSVSATVPTTNGAKYLQQLCKHWGHKLEVQQAGDSGVVRFADGVATMKADANALVVTIEAGGEETVERLKGVVARHLDRFAFREAPLPFAWSPD